MCVVTSDVITQHQSTGRLGSGECSLLAQCGGERRAGYVAMCRVLVETEDEEHGTESGVKMRRAFFRLRRSMRDLI